MCGFREKYSTQHAICQLLSDLESWLDDGQYAGQILMDLSKAYDCNPYDLLLAKLQTYGINENSLIS